MSRVTGRLFSTGDTRADWLIPKRSFTMVEMLVVIAVMTILVSLLLPSLNRAVDTARGTMCANNQRQLYLVGDQYRDEFHKWANASYWLSEGGENWYQHLFRNTNLSASLRYTHGPWGNGTIVDPSYKLMKCPSNSLRDPDGWCGWYDVNYIANAVSNCNVPGGGGKAYPRTPSNIPWIVDGKRYMSTSAWCSYAPGTVQSLTDGVMLLHNECANVAFFDGHTAPLPSSGVTMHLWDNRINWQ